MDKNSLKKVEGKTSWLIDTFKVSEKYDFEYILNGVLHRSFDHLTEEKALEDFIQKTK